MKFKVGYRVAVTEGDGAQSLGFITVVDARDQPPWAPDEPDDPHVCIRWDDGERDIYFSYEFEYIEILPQ
jgi:hypothetical protein